MRERDGESAYCFYESHDLLANFSFCVSTNEVYTSTMEALILTVDFETCIFFSFI